MDLGQNLLKRRTELGLSQGALARALGLKNRATISLLESGSQKSLDFDTMLQLCRVLAITPNDLLGWEG